MDLKYLPRKCQLFKIELQYMGDVIFIKDRKVCVRPLRSRLEAILKAATSQQLQNGCRRFAEIVQFSKHILPRVAKDIKTQYTIEPEKVDQFVWGGRTAKYFWRNKA